LSSKSEEKISVPVIARLNIKGKRFEVFVWSDKAWLFKQGKISDIHEVLVGNIIYSDARKGLKASRDDIVQIFGSDDIGIVAEKILKKGTLQITSEQRRELIENLKRRIIAFISRNCIDPRTNLPIPPSRVEIALKEAKVSLDPFKPLEIQIENVIKQLRPILPLKIAKAVLAVKIPPQYIGKCYGYISKVGRILLQNYLSDGSLSLELEIPAGIKEGVIEKIARLTKGRGEVKIIR